MSSEIERHCPPEWSDVYPATLHKKFTNIKELADDRDQGQYTLVQHKSNRALFVRKTLKKMIKGNERPDRWLREIEVIRELRHENIQMFRGACLCVIQGDIYLEHCNFGSLRHFKRFMDGPDGGPVPEAFAEFMFKGLVAALAFLHYGIHKLEHGHTPDVWGIGSMPWTPIWHCDITIDSVFLQKYEDDVYPVAKLSKFNFACRQVGDTYSSIPIWSQTAGTEGWVPPEHPTKCERSDVFQIGAVIQCLCNPNWAKADPEGGLPRGYSEDFQKLIRAAMARRIGDRSNAVELVRMLLAINGGLPSQFTPIPNEAFERTHAESM